SGMEGFGGHGGAPGWPAGRGADRLVGSAGLRLYGQKGVVGSVPPAGGRRAVGAAEPRSGASAGAVCPGLLDGGRTVRRPGAGRRREAGGNRHFQSRDRKSTRLNSSHVKISYAVFCLKKKKDIGASEFLGVQPLTVSVYTTWLTRSHLPGAAQISLAMLLLVVVLRALDPPGRRPPASS